MLDVAAERQAVGQHNFGTNENVEYTRGPGLRDFFGILQDGMEAVREMANDEVSAVGQSGRQIEIMVCLVHDIPPADAVVEAARQASTK